MLMTHWLNLLRTRMDGILIAHTVVRRSRDAHHRLRPFAADAVAPWFTRRLQPARATAGTHRVRQLRAHQRLG